MAFANPNYTDILATTIEKRQKKLADNVLKNNVLYAKLNAKGRVEPVDGGTYILEELMFAENGNAMWYSGDDFLNISGQDVLSAAQYSWAQAAVAVTLNGLDKLKNSGRERMIGLMAGRVSVAEKSLMNLLAAAVYSDGTGFGGKQLTGLNAAVPTAPTVGTYGGIDRAAFSFWQPALTAPGAGVITAANINTYMNDLWAKIVRNQDRPDLIIFDTNLWKLYTAYLQDKVRFTNPSTAKLGWPSVPFMDADVVLDGGIGGYCPTNTGFFLNTDYIKLRPHADRNMVPLDPSQRAPTNQDIVVQLIGFAGNLTVSNSSLQGRIHNN